MNRIKLSKQAFKNTIGKGRGIVLQFLVQQPLLDNEYHSIVKWACTTFTHMNLQDDGTNARYYYEIIELMSNKKEITNFIVDFLENSKLIMHHRDFDNVMKAFAILSLCARNDKKLNHKIMDIYKDFYSKSKLIVEQSKDGSTCLCENFYMTLSRFLFQEITGFDDENDREAYVENFQIISNMLLDDIIEGKIFEIDDIFWQFNFSMEMISLIQKLALKDCRYQLIIDFFKKQNEEKKIITDEERVKIAKKKQEREEEKKNKSAVDPRQQLFYKHITDDTFLLAEISKARGKEQIENLISYIISSIEYTGKSSLAALVMLYGKSYCTNCRFELVRMMNRFHTIPKHILDECIYDCNLELRKYAAEISKKINIPDKKGAKL